jgi:hypothetical protein
MNVSTGIENRGRNLLSTTGQVEGPILKQVGIPVPKIVPKAPAQASPRAKIVKDELVGEDSIDSAAIKSKIIPDIVDLIK